MAVGDEQAQTLTLYFSFYATVFQLVENIDWLIDWALLRTHNKTYMYIHEYTDVDYISVQSNIK